MLYAEALRPKNLEQLLALKPSLLAQIKELLKDPGLLPHLILEGLPGTGKTTSARIIAQEILGRRTQFNYLELNASSQRGVEVIRSKITDFVKVKAFMKLGAQKTPYKIIFLDEADQLTKDAQTALRNTMETFASNARFIFSCNHLEKMISPIQSRCYVLKFEAIIPKRLKEALRYILSVRNIVVDEEKLELAVNNAKGDMRKACNFLTASSESLKNLKEEKEWVEETLKKFKDLKDSIEILNYLRPTFRSDHEKIIKGYLKILPSAYRDHENWSIEKVLNALIRLAEVDSAINRGANPDIQIAGYVSYVISLANSC